MFQTFDAVPYWDQWDHLTLSDLTSRFFEQHNEHRIAVPRLIFMLDWFAGGRNVVSLAATLLIQVAHALLLGRIASRYLPSERRELRLAAFAVPIAFLFSLSQSENFYWGFAVQVPLVYAATTASFAVLAFGSDDLKSAGLALLCAAIATYSMANGVASSPLLVLLAWLLGRSRRQRMVLGVGALALVCSYLNGYHASGVSTHPVDALRDPWSVCRYVLAYLGGPLASHAGPTQVRTASIFGVLVLGANLWLGIKLVWHRRETSASQWVLWMVALFVFATAGMAALGRVGMSVEQALAIRYATPVLVVWSATLLNLGLVLVRSNLRTEVPVLGWQLAALACVLVLVGRQGSDRSGAFHHAELRRTASTALLSRANDAQAFLFVYPSEQRVFQNMDRLRDAKRSIFAEPWSNWLGERLADHASSAPAADCKGALEELVPVASLDGLAMRAGGWAYLTEERRRPEHVVLVDDKTGKVVGYAKTGLVRKDLVARHRLENSRTGFRGHVGSLVRSDTDVVAYALTSSGAACRLAGSIHVSATPLMIETAPVALPLELDPPAMQGFSHAGAACGPPSTGGEAFGSRGEASPAKLSWHGQMPEGARRLGVPLCIGPGIGAASQKLVRVTGDDGQQWGAIDAAFGFDPFRVWSVARPASASSGFTIEIEDRGAAAEHWVALGTPLGLP